MKGLGISSLRGRLMLLVLLAVIAAMGVIGYMGVEERDQARAEALKEAIRVAKLASADQERILGETRNLLGSLALLTEIQAPDTATCSQLLARVQPTYPYAANLGLIALDGSLECSALPFDPSVNLTDRAYFQRALQTGDFSSGDYQLGRVTGVYSINFGYPVLDEAGRPRSVLFAAVSLDWLNQLAAQAELPQGSTLTLFDSQGTILARYPDSAEWVGKVEPGTPIFETIRASGGEGTAQSVGIDGVERLYGFTRLSAEQDGGVSVSVGIPTEFAFAPVTRSVSASLVGLALVGALALFAAWYGAEVLVLRRVRVLLGATERLAGGDLSVRAGPPYGGGELGRLADSFDAMAQALEQEAAARVRSQSALVKVARALRTLSASNQALLHARDEATLLDEICQAVVDPGGYRLAWVCFAQDNEEKTVRPMAHAGFEDGYLDTVDITWADETRGHGPIGTAIRTGQPAVAQDILSHPTAGPWRAEALKRGYASVVALPLLEDGRPFGAVAIYAAEADAFDEEELKLLRELADDLAFGITTLRMREQHRQSEMQVMRQLQHLDALRKIDLAITASLDPRLTFNVLLDQVTDQLKIDAAAILIFDRHTRTLSYLTGRGFRTEALRHTRLRLGEGHAGMAALDRRIVSIADFKEVESGFSRSPLLKDEGFISYFAVPLVAKGTVQGVLEIFHRSPLNPEQAWLDFLEALAGQAAIAIDNATMFEDLHQSNLELVQAYDTTLEGWARALELRDRETLGHSERVTEVTLRLAQRVGMAEADLVHVRRGALLHDIGKMGIPDSILLKAGPLTDEEWVVMRQHPVHAHDLLSRIDYLRPALDIPYAHHEKWDGTGYPRGLKAEEIPLAARVFAVVDVWDALNSERPYRPAWPRQKVRGYLQEQAGVQFDPKIVAAFLKEEEDLAKSFRPGGSE